METSVDLIDQSHIRKRCKHYCARTRAIDELNCHANFWIMAGWMSDACVMKYVEGLETKGANPFVIYTCPMWRRLMSDVRSSKCQV